MVIQVTPVMVTIPLTTLHEKPAPSAVPAKYDPDSYPCDPVEFHFQSM